MNVIPLFLLLTCYYACAQGQTQDPKDWTRLKLTTGAIRGRKVVTDRNTTAFVFQGIPFAEPPVGDLRYRAPTEKKPWKGELLVQDYKFTCMLTRIILQEDRTARNKSEDCLHVNVFTTEKCLLDKNCPVMYYIHGGKWNFDSPFLFADDFLIDNYQSKNIVLVSLTYRMGSFGFFNTEKKSSADKNLGLLDMILGLEWTQREIGAFGGDKNKVTVMGHSSGAEAVDQLSISPKTAGLFHQIAVMSGPAGMYSLRRDNNVKQSKALAILAGCATEELWDAGDSFEVILKCLREKTGDELVNYQKEVEEGGQSFDGPMLDDPDGILPDETDALIRNRRPYRMLIGTTNREFRFTAMIVDEEKEVNRPLLYAMCVFMAKTRGITHPVAVGRACAEDYLERPSDAADLGDDIIIYVPTYDSSEAMRHKGATVYKYSFEYNQIGEAFVGKTDFIEGPFHAQDLVYVMGLHYNKFTPKDQQIRKIYSGIFADFILTGDPSPPTHPEKWQPTDDRNNYFKINFDDNMKMPGNTNGYHAAAVEFWEKEAPEIDTFFSKWDINGTFSFKKLAQDLIRGLKEKGVDVNDRLTDDVSKWSDNPNDWDKSMVENLGKVLRELLQKTRSVKDDKDDDLRSHVITQSTKQLVRKILPAVRETPATVSTADWQTWFWVATGVAVFLIILLLLTCCGTCYQRSKRVQYQRIEETTRLNPSSSKLYG